MVQTIMHLIKQKKIIFLFLQLFGTISLIYCWLEFIPRISIFLRATYTHNVLILMEYKWIEIIHINFHTFLKSG